ncbi:sensor histidine kinase [Luteimonas suaedae]|uniref:sensor histidine kinase n=1 Tax=Luteimonas suaedae TaxID=2605430 RepID=UPI0011EED0C4|nr:ATP-binding protein [Luteimonas suaedae]
MWRTLGGWLQRAPIDDPVDRRNAPMLQVVLLILGALPPLMWLYRIFGTDIAWRPGETASLVSSLLISAVALFCFVLIRRGRFQWALRQLLVVVALMMLVAYAGSGISAQVYEQPIQVLWLFVAGMMVGRRALWAMYAVLAAALFVGAVSEARSTDAELAHLVGDAAIRSVMFLLIAVVVDRSVAALRGSLEEATRRGHELARANRRLEAEIAAREQAQAQLLHTQKVEAVGRMCAGVAHDFNHLMTLMLGYIEQGKQAGSEAEMAKALSGLESAAHRATAITRKLLHFSRQEVTRIEVFDAGEALRDMQPMLRQTLGAGIVLDLRLPGDDCPIAFDRAQFGLAILNMTANAAHAMPDGGRFRIDLRALQDLDEVEIVLGDNGHGMKRDVQARAFEPFFTTKPSGQGTGLGLAIVRNLVESAGGSIDLDSNPGVGTRFFVRLPMADGTAGPGRERAGSAEQR